MVLSEIMPFVRVKSRRNNGCPPIAPTFTNYDFMHLGTILNSVADFAGVSLSTACRIVAYIAAIARLYGKILFWALGPQTNFIISLSFLEYMVPLIVHTYTVSLHVGTYFYIILQNRTFKVWKHRFPIILRTMKLSLEDITKVIMATAALHNICRNYSIEEMAPEVELPRESVVTVTSENLENNITHKQEII